MRRKYNRGRDPLVYNTIQGYLKGARENAATHIRLAASEGWSLGIKLVRGAYIDHETRSLIHDTKEETDKSYSDIATSIINQRLPGQAISESSKIFPRTALFLASHNMDSIRNSLTPYQERVNAGNPTVLLECGQLQGMADEISYALLKRNKEDKAARLPYAKPSIPTVFKCLTWGSMEECMHYLYRRAIENRGAVVRTKHMAKALRQELARRLYLKR